MSQRLRYCIADDHAIFRQGIRYALSGTEELACVGEAGNGLELMRLLQTTATDVVLLDLRMPAMDGVEATTALRRQHPETKILILTMHYDEALLVHLLARGANGYLLKDAEPAEIVTAVRDVCESGYYFNDIVSSALLKKVIEEKPQPGRPVHLTERELQVLRLICGEQTTPEIAQQLCISPRTVESVRAAMLQKLNLRNTAGLVLYAVRNGLILPN